MPGNYTVICWGCMTEVYASDTEIAADPAALKATFADASCPKGGTAGGCPSTTDAQAAQDDQRPAKLQALITAISARVPRTTRLALPALAANTVTEVPVTWPTAMPDATYSVASGIVCPATLAGKIAAALKPGSATTAGCSLLVVSTVAVAAGGAGLHVVATP